MSFPVLVLGDDSRSFLSVVRSLGRRGVAVHGAGCDAGAPACASRYLQKIHALPNHDRDPGAYLSALSAVLTTQRFELVLPCNDQSILPLHAHRGALSRLAPLYLLSEEAQAVTSDKRRTAELARSLGIPVPREILAPSGRGAEAAAEALSRFGLPLVVKPLSSFRLGALDHKRLVRVVTSEAALYRLLAALSPEGDVLLQEHLPGIGVGVEALAWEGEVLFAFQHVRVHEPPSGGGSSYRRSAALHPALLAATRRLLAALRYTGVAMAEFRWNEQAGAYALLEINGRFWGSLPLAVAAGADFPFYLYEMLVHGRRRFPPGYRVGLHCRNVSGDLSYLWQSLRARRGAALLAVPLEARHALLGRERLDTLTLDDPAPALVELQTLAAQVGGAAMVRTAAHLSRRAGRLSRLRDELARARCLLFVCKGNICRSPFAAALAARRRPTVRCLSAGYAAAVGRPSPALAIRAAAEVGVDLSQHRACAVDEAILAQAELILAVDEESWRAVWSRHPLARGRLFHLAPLCGAAEVPDPDGGSLAEFRACYALLARALTDPADETRARAPRAASSRASSSAPQAQDDGR